MLENFAGVGLPAEQFEENFFTLNINRQPVVWEKSLNHPLFLCLKDLDGDSAFEPKYTFGIKDERLAGIVLVMFVTVMLLLLFFGRDATMTGPILLVFFAFGLFAIRSLNSGLQSILPFRLSIVLSLAFLGFLTICEFAPWSGRYQNDNEF